MTDESTIIQSLQGYDVRAFKALIIDCSEDMTILASLLLNDHNRAVMIVDDILLRLLDPEYVSSIELPIRIHLFNEVRVACGYPV